MIYEALKKTQQNLGKPAASATMPPPPVTHSRRWLRLGLVIALAFLIFIEWKYPPVPTLATQRPTQVAMKHTGRMILTGVFVSKKERLAIINNRTVHEGDTINQMKVIKINFDGVALQDGDQQLMVRKEV